MVVMTYGDVTDSRQAKKPIMPRKTVLAVAMEIRFALPLIMPVIVRPPASAKQCLSSRGGCGCGAAGRTGSMEQGAWSRGVS